MNKIAGSFEDAYEFENSTFSIRKMILPRKNKDGLTKVIIEVRQHKYTGTGQYQDIFKRIATDVWILPKNWHKKKELVNDNEVDAELKNKDINKVFAAVQKFIDSKGKQVPDQAYIEAVNLQVEIHLSQCVLIRGLTGKQF